MPPLTNASYVGRLAPPGRPNTTSTPSAFRHSITASTARISPTSSHCLGVEKNRVYQWVFRRSGRDSVYPGQAERRRPRGTRALPAIEGGQREGAQETPSPTPIARLMTPPTVMKISDDRIGMLRKRLRIQAIAN